MAMDYPMSNHIGLLYKKKSRENSHGSFYMWFLKRFVTNLSLIIYDAKAASE